MASIERWTKKKKQQTTNEPAMGGCVRVINHRVIHETVHRMHETSIWSGKNLDRIFINGYRYLIIDAHISIGIFIERGASWRRFPSSISFSLSPPLFISLSPLLSRDWPIDVCYLLVPGLFWGI